MMHDSPPRIDPVLNLARNQMELVTNIHLVHLAIVSGKDETKVLEFDDASIDQMMREVIPSLIRDIKALGVIVSSPARKDGKYGAVVTLVDRTLEAFYVPILRIINADTMIGEFRATDVPNPSLFGRIHKELCSNWLTRGDH